MLCEKEKRLRSIRSRKALWLCVSLNRWNSANRRREKARPEGCKGVSGKSGLEGKERISGSRTGHRRRGKNGG